MLVSVCNGCSTDREKDPQTLPLNGLHLVTCRMHVIVLDEADLLLSGGFERDVGRILDNMKQNDKERQAHCLSHELGIPPEDFQGLPRHVKAAGFEGSLITNAIQQLEQPSCSVITGLSMPASASEGLCSRPYPSQVSQGTSVH